MISFPPINADSPWVENLLTRLPPVKVAVFGDLYLDVYWMLDSAASERSLETGLEAHRVKSQHCSPGAGGNVAVNLAALGVGQVEMIGWVGADLFGDELLRQLAARGVSTEHIVRSPAGPQTLVYAKPYRDQEELNRFDFGPDGELPPPGVVGQLLGKLRGAASRCPVVVINQQFPRGWSAEFLEGINRVIAAHANTLFIVDSRNHAAEFRGAALKLNIREAAAILGRDVTALSPDDALSLAESLERRQKRPIFITRGEFGLVVAAGGELHDIPGIELPGSADPVGAGDTALAALAATFAAGAAPLESGSLANIAAAITTRQLHTTGVATPDQIRAVGPAPDYVFSPRLAEQPRLARFLPHTRIETITGRPPPRRLRHAIFDHDGTVSTIRQGWEAIMEPMMLQSILGSKRDQIDDATYARVVSTVRAFIDRTTGIQTLAQMKGLVGLVQEFGFVPTAEIRDEHAYKAIFNEELLAMVAGRIRQLESGELVSEDWQIKHARAMLERLRQNGVTLYLASGTDQADTEAEARRLGYAHLFDGGIYGAVGNLQAEAKRDVLRRILETSGVRGDEIIVIGDGPVEIREGRRHGGYAVGIASDEVRRHGLNLRKRARLIRAGADIVIGDFCQLDALAAYLGLH